jgi:hypothetical protein
VQRVLFTAELDIPEDYNDDDVIALFHHIAVELTEGTTSEDISTHDGRTVGTWEAI